MNEEKCMVKKGDEGERGESKLRIRVKESWTIRSELILTIST